MSTHLESMSDLSSEKTGEDREETIKLLQEREAWEAEKRDLQDLSRTLIQKMCEVEDKVTRALEENAALQRKVQELADALKEQPKEAEVIQSFNDIALVQLQEESKPLLERVRLLEEKQQSESGGGVIQATRRQSKSEQVRAETKRRPTVWERLRRKRPTA